jgi:hypothetical protein
MKKSHLYELQPDPYDVTQRRFLRVCVFKDVKNAVELRELLRSGELDAAMIRAELVSIFKCFWIFDSYLFWISAAFEPLSIIKLIHHT